MLNADDARFLIGIDLGTTNSAVSYVDRSVAKKGIQLFKVKQTVAPGEIHEKRTLPSFYYFPPAHEVNNGLLDLPWSKNPDGVAGIHARQHGGGIPDRFIASAKSWLAHPGVDRMADILPWGSEHDQKLSPVAVSKKYLEHIRNAWDGKFRSIKDSDGSPCLLADQQVVLTVPASFDEVARELTVQAAKDAGYKNLTLLEEPLAAFYSWLDHNENWADIISEKDQVLIVDIGGGTSDFSLISVENDNTLRRTAVGNHLLLGGDNIDMAIARSVEANWKKKLNQKEWGVLVQQCRQAKEVLLSEGAPEHMPVSVSTGGSSLVGGNLSGKVTKESVLSIINDGFYPTVEKDGDAPEKKSGLRDLGLPYEKDPAITKHLLNFLKKASKTDQPEIPDVVLFNGGSMIPEFIRNRVLEVLNSWAGDKEVREIESADLDLAVSNGAAYYAQVKMGEGVKVQGGIARAYYLKSGGEEHAIFCAMPRDTSEGMTQEVQHVFKVITNKPVQFPVYSSATRLDDALGSKLSDEDDDLTQLPSLQTVIQFGKKNESRKIDVKVSTLLNETGTMEVWLSALETDHKWKLNFDMRALHNQSEEADDAAALNKLSEVAISDDKVKGAEAMILAAFDDKEKLKTIIKDLEKLLEMPRNNWPLSLIRPLADVMLNIKDVRSKSASHEARWLNLTGFFVRPGFGDASDAFRMKQLWPLWMAGVKNKTDQQANAEYWVFWRRIAGGLKRGHQDQIAHGVIKNVMPKDKYKINTKNGSQEKREMWRTLGSLEIIDPKLKARAVDVLLGRMAKIDNFELWTVGRLAARKPFYGPADLIVKPKRVTQWLDNLSSYKKTSDKSYLFCLSSIGSFTGDKTIDIDSNTKSSIESILKSNNAPAYMIQSLHENVKKDEEQNKQILGDSLPIGLEL